MTRPHTKQAFTELMMELTLDQALQQGVEAHKAGQVQEADRLYTAILKAQPKHPDANHNMGVLAVGVGKVEQALPFFKTALEANQSIAQYWLSYIDALIKLDRIANAKSVLDQAKDKGAKGDSFDKLEEQLEGLVPASATVSKSQDPPQDMLQPIINLYNQGQFQQALDEVLKVLHQFPNAVTLYNIQGAANKGLGHLDTAIEAYNKSLAIEPDYADVHSNMGGALTEQGKLEEAIDAYKKDGSPKSQLYLLECLYEINEQADFYNQLDYLINQNDNNATIGSYISRSQIRYGINKENPFCNDPLKYVLHTNLTDQCDFENIFVKGATDILTKDIVQNRSQSLLTNGIQTTGNVFNQIGSFTDRIQSILRSEIENYWIHFQDSQEGLIKSWPSNYEINGWLVSMKTGGKLAAHMHDKGWISGSIYINVPPKLKKDSGNLVVTTDDSKHGKGKTKNRKSINVVTGSLCLFPSSLLHYTIPFESHEDRIVLAFDVIPK